MKKNHPPYRKISTKIREYILKMLYQGQSAHAGSNLSTVDLLTVLYFNILNINPKDPEWEDRDRFILSKGHAAAVMWAILAEKGFFSRERLNTYYKNNGLPGHVTKLNVPGVDFSTGSLGHGLSFACGVALSAKRYKKNYHTFVILGDGEMDEGSIWEALLFAPHNKLDNLTVIVDYNKIQSLDYVENILDLEPLYDKLKAFGWNTIEIDGHNHKEIEKALNNTIKNKPTFIIAHTIKGKGVSFMENSIDWHYWNIDEKMLQQAFNELKIRTSNDFGS